MKSYHQQGDVLLFSTPIPSTAIMKELENGILQHGETTGHSHRLEDYREEEELDAIYFEDLKTGKRYLRLLRPRKIKHEEHKEILLPYGDYEIGIVRTISDFDDMIMPVRD